MKTNHKISIMQAGLSVLCGVVLAVHRSRPASTGAAMAVVGLAAATVLALGGLRICQLREKLQLKPASTDKLGFSILALSGFLFLLAAAFFFLENTASLLGIIIALFCGFCGVATILRVSQRDSGKTAAVYSLVPIFFLSFFLLMLYRSNGDNPNLRLFGYEIAVMLLVLLGMYLAVAGRFEGDRPRFRSIGCSIGFCLIAQEMISFLLMPQMLLSIPDFSVAALVMLLACGLLLCYGMFFPSVREVFPEPAVEDADTSEEETENPASPS